MSSNIQVAIKVRPLIKREIEENSPIQWVVEDKYMCPVDPELKKRGDGFSFDHIFDTDTTNKDVFDTVAKPIVEATITGFNGTIFAYGQTGSGKTYTMMGNSNVPGVIPLAIDHIFGLITKIDREFLLRVSYIEIYNERVNDLLEPDGTDLKITEDPKTGQVKVNCREEVVSSPENVLTIVKKGNKNRRIGETNMNERSSRGHTILRITIESRSLSADESEAVQVSQLNLVDLAGSERSGQTGAVGTRFKEGTHINMSLSTLGLVIKQLSESQDNPKAYVNFRDSKLTRILRCSLGGNALTTIICAVTPAAFEETQCTLAFASRAKRIHNKPKVNEELSEAALLKRYARQITKLETDLEKANSINVVAMESQLLAKERAYNLLVNRIELLKKSILCGNSSTEKNTAATGMDKRRRTWCGTVTAKVLNREIINLPTIDEVEKSVDTEKKQVPSRGECAESIIIKDLDIVNESFQTGFADFELELIKSERERVNDRLSICSEADEEYVLKKRMGRTVTFRDTAHVFNDQPRNSDQNDESTSPEQCNRNPELPETPKVALRKRIKFLMEQYNSLSEENGTLMEFTTLEKQTIVDEEVEKAMGVHNEKLAASEQMFSELNAKYAKLQTHSENTDKLLAESKDRLADFERRMTESTESLRALRREKQALVEELNKLRGNNSTVRSSMTIGSDNETSSIFENEAYFEDMNVSDAQTDSIFIGDTTSLQNTQDLTMYDSNLGNITANTTVTNDVREVKLLAEQLRETVQLLTIENADLTNKLANEKERAEQNGKNLEDTISELLTKIHSITEEKNLLRSRMSELEKKSAISNEAEPNVVTDDETARLIRKYKDTIDSLTAENTELSSSLMDKIEELDRAKDVKNLSNDHACVYRELSNNLGERNKLLENENIELSNNLMEKIEEYDRLKEELEAVTRSATTTSLPQSEKLIEISMNVSNIMDREITTNIGALLRPDFGANYSSRSSIQNERMNGDDTRDLSMSINGERSICDSNENVVLKGELAVKNEEFNASKIGQSTIEESLEKSVVLSNMPREDEARDDLIDSWRIKAEMLAERVNELQQLNLKLKDLKLTNCKQCAHLTDLNEDRRALKNEVRQMTVKVRETNIKLQELQGKFDREYAHGEILRTKANEDLNISIGDSTLNESAFLDGSFSVSVVEERVQRLRNELDALTEQHGRLTSDYNEKCHEIEKLQEAGSRETTPSPSANGSTRLRRNAEKIEKIENDMEYTKTYLRRLKKEISGVRAALHKFENERASLRNEIENLTAEKIELEKKSAAVAELSNASEGVEIMKEEIERLRETINGFDTIKRDLESANSRLEAQLRTSENEREVLVKKFAEIDVSSDSKEKIKALLRELSTLNEKMEVTMIANRELRDAKLSMEAECDFLTMQKTVADEGSNELMRSIGDLEDENALLKSRLEKLESAKVVENRSTMIPEMQDSTPVEPLRPTIEEASEEATRHTERNAELDERLTNISANESELDDLKSQLKNVNESLEKIVAENASLKNKLPEFETFEKNSSLLESLKSQLKEANEEATRHAERNAELEERLTNIFATEAELDDLKTKLKNVKESLDKIVAENTRLEGKLTEFETFESNSSLLESLKLRFKEASEEATRYAERNAELEERLTNISASEAELDDLKSQLKNVNESLEKIVAENASLKNKLTEFETFEKNSSLLESLESQLKEAKEAATRHAERNAELEERLTNISATEAELDDLKTQLRNVKQSLDKIVAENTRLEKKLSEFETFENNSSLLESLKLRFKEASEEATRYAERNAELEERLTKMSTTVAELDDLKSQLKSVNESLEEIVAENASLKNKLTEFETVEKNSSLLESLKSQLKEANEEATRHAERNAELEERLTKISATEAELDDLKSQLKSVNESLEEIVAENASLKNKLTEFETFEKNPSILESLKSQLKEANEEATRHAERNAELEERLTKISAKEVDHLKSQLKNVNDSPEQIVAENASLKEKLNEFETSNNKSSRNSATLPNNNEIADNRTDSSETSDSCLREYEKTIEVLNVRVREITIELERYAVENAELNDKIVGLRDSLEKRSANTVESDSSMSDLRNELDSARESITREINSLKPSVDCKDITVSELFVVFVREIMSKEKELMRRITANFEQEKRQLTESKRQSDDAEKRAKVWAKELEADIEKVQQDLIARGAKVNELTGEISRLTNMLMESNHENEMLKEKMQVLELDFNTLQADLETSKGAKSGATQQAKERLIEEAMATREMELSSKLQLASKQYKEKLDELTSTIESYKIKNSKLTNNMEAIVLNEKSMKKIIEKQTADLTMCNTTIEKMQNNLKILTDRHDELCRKNDEKSQQIAEITSLLKNKCDTLSEYKTKLETITPEYETLKEQAAERQARLEMYKSEIECMTNENATTLSSLREKLANEETKSSGYRKQLNELTNKNLVLQKELEELREKYNDLEISNAKMAKSLRNSTSKIRVEHEMEELRDSNKTLQSNLDGAANRIIELQEMKTQATNELAELRRSHETLSRNNVELTSAIATLKVSLDDASKLRERCELLATENRTLALELKNKKSTIEEMQRSLESRARENEELLSKNKELDEEMDDMANKIHELTAENATLENKLYDLSNEKESRVIERVTNAEIQRLKSKVAAREETIKESESLRDRLYGEIATATTNANRLTEENRMLREKIGRMERANSSCSGCAKRDSRRRRSRSDLFDQNRQIDAAEIAGANPSAEESRCAELENKVRELELELVTKKGQLAALKVSIIREERPYKEEAEELRELNKAARHTIEAQKAEIQKLLNSNAKLSSECKRHENSSRNRADKSTQCFPEPSNYHLGALGRIFNPEHERSIPESERLQRQQKYIEALEDTCRTHVKNIASLKKKIATLEKGPSSETSSDNDRREESPPLRTVKEELRRNIV